MAVSFLTFVLQSTAPRKPAKFGQRFFTRGANYQSTSDLDVKVEITKQPKLTEYDRDLKRFRYRDALDRVIMVSGDFESVLLCDIDHRTPTFFAYSPKLNDMNHYSERFCYHDTQGRVAIISTVTTFFGPLCSILCSILVHF